MALIAVLALDILLTFLAANIVGPAAFRFSHYGLPGLLFRTPFYLLRFYIGIGALLLRRQPNWFLWGPALGLALTAPLAFWANLPICHDSRALGEPGDWGIARGNPCVDGSSFHRTSRVQLCS